MKHISSAENHDPIEMKVVCHARKIYVNNLIKAMLLIMILGLMSLFSKLWAQIPIEGAEIVYKDVINDEHQTLIEQLLSYAREQQKIATAATMEANNARLISESNEREMNKLLYLSAAQNMAVKSLNINDHSLQGLIAQQAYLLNVKYEGNPLDRYIYEGLYFALKSLTGDSLYLLGRHRGIVRDLAINSTSKKLFSASTDGQIINWDLENPNHTGQALMSGENGRCKVVKTTSDDRWIIVGTDASSIYCFNQQREGGKPLIITGHIGSIVDMAVLPDNRHFISLSNDKTLRINDLTSGQGKLLKNLDEPYLSMTISADGKYLALSAENGKLIVLDTKNYFQEYVILPAGSPINRSIAFNRTGNMLAAGNTLGIVNMINLSSGPDAPVILQLGGHMAARYINDVAFSEDGKYFASGGFDGTILLWDMNNLNNLPVILRDNNAKVWSLVFSYDGNYLYAGCENGAIRMWPTKSEFISEQLISKLTRDMTREEWLIYAGVEEPGVSYKNSLSMVKP